MYRAVPLIVPGTGITALNKPRVPFQEYKAGTQSTISEEEVLQGK